MPPGDADVELTDESDFELETFRGGARTCNDSEDDPEPLRGVANITNNPFGEIVGSATTVSEMLGCHQAIFE